MKKFLVLVLALCFLLSMTASAFAAGKPAITKQPQTATTNKKGSVSFSISFKGSVDSLTWYFVNPENGEKYSGKKIKDVFKGLKVSSPNGKKISLSKVPAEMHGWTVYCHLNGNGYKVDSESATLYVYGMEPAEGESSSASPASDNEPASEAEPAPEAETVPDAESVPEEPAADVPVENPDDVPAEISDNTITVTAGSSILWKLDNAGNPEGDGPSSSLEFINQGSFMVKSDEPIKSWTVNGLRFEPGEPITEFRMLNISENIVIDLGIVRPTAATAQVDESNMCKVTCKGCTFSYLAAGLISVTEGEVPAGAPINIVADSAALASTGYTINGGEAINAGKASFRYTVTEDALISAE